VLKQGAAVGVQSSVATMLPLATSLTSALTRAVTLGFGMQECVRDK